MDHARTTVGRLAFDRPLEHRLRHDLTDLSRWWRVEDDGVGLSPHHEDEVAEALQLAADDLRRLVRVLCRPHGLELDGVLVLPGAGDLVLSVTVHHNRVATRQLWPPPTRGPRSGPTLDSDDAATSVQLSRQEAAGRCAVIDLTSRIRRR